MSASGLAKRMANLEPHRFQPGENYHIRKAAERSRLQAEITAELGGSLSTADAILLMRAVELLIVRPKSHTDAVRATNTANRILRALRAKYAAKQIAPLPAPYPLETARELLERLKP
jgi:hypothetical protein